MQENDVNTNHEDEFRNDRGKKRGFLSPLNNQNKKKVTDDDVTELLLKFKNTENSENKNAEEPEDEEVDGAFGTSTNL